MRRNKHIARKRRFGAAALAALFAAGCAAPAPMPFAEHVDIERFMGRWYVLAGIHTFLERDAYNAVETYRLDDDGTIATTFTMRRGGFDGKRVEYTPRGFVNEENPALWGMQFVWPIKAEYRIVYLADDYSQTVVGRSARDYVWLMGRTPELTDDDYARFLALLEQLQYDTSQVRRVPHRW